MSTYELKIVSKHRESDGEVFRTFNVDGERAIGVKRNEPFEIHFNNNSSLPVQVKLSLDGTDILTGEIANSFEDGEMWYVKARDTLVVKAFPENYNGGARFVFTDGEKGVAVNTHGEESAIGLIGAAVFTDSLHKYNSPIYYISPQKWWNEPYWNEPYWTVNPADITHDTCLYGGTISSTNANFTNSEANVRSLSACSMGASCSSDAAEELSDDLSVGAGEYVEQEIQKVAGLNKPRLSRVLQVRYMPWKKLSKIVGVTDRVRKQGTSAFPGDNFGINLDNVPKVQSSGVQRKRKKLVYKSNRFI